MPEMKGKFRRCILESGGIRATATSVHYGHGNPQEAVAHGRMVLEDLGIEDTSEGMLKLRDIPAEELLLKWYFGKDGGLHGFRAGPVLDGLLFEGDLVPDPHLQPPDDVDLLFGFNTDEGTMFADPAMTEPQYINVLQNMFPDNWRKVLERYPADEEHSPYRQLSDIYGLQKFKGAMLPYAEILSDKGMNVYAYHFDYLTDKLRSEGLGVRHIAELPFVFDSFLHTVGADDEAGHDMALIIHNAWVNFIKTGDPGYNWKKYDCKSHTAMRFTMEGIKLQSIERIDEMLWLDGIL
jgi:carboxylesterase type B